MTTLDRIALKCPCCGTCFNSPSVRTSNCMATRTDFMPITHGFPYIPLRVHTCMACGYSGPTGVFALDFQLSEAVKAKVVEKIAPLLTSERPPAASRCEYAAMIAEWSGWRPFLIGRLYLWASYCCYYERNMKLEHDEDYYRRHAIKCYEQALCEQGRSDSTKSMLAYLVGELYRRIGDLTNAAAWFDHVASLTGGRRELQHWVRLAQRQKTEPKDLI